jgi:YidC/Oxa1 family membrane protein insertase
MEEKQSQLSTIVGMGLIFLLLYLWMQYSAPPKQTEQAQTNTTQVIDTTQQAAQTALGAAAQAGAPMPDDTAMNAVLVAKFGVFAPAATGREQIEILENNFMRVTFTSKGGRIKEVFLKNYEKINSDTAGNDVKSPLRLLEDEKNRFEYLIPVQNAMGGTVNTSDLYFAVSKNANSITFRADAGQGRAFEQTYTLQPNNYALEYKIDANGLRETLASGQNKIRLNWVNYLDKIERNQTYERTYSTVYFKENDDEPDYCDCRNDATENLGTAPVRWVSHSHQFFNTSLIANDFTFTEFVGETKMFTDQDPDLKLLRTSAAIPLDNPVVNMTLYAGPNEFARLRSYKVTLEDIIPFGASLFGAINRWIVRPMFDILSGFIGNKGIVILMLTLLVKLILYPLTYRMVLGQARMAALKPHIDALKKKHGDDQQTMSMETMKLYSEFRVNPLSGCMPIFLQMPIWFALYRFFPAAIEFRQAGFLWATDLSSYDIALHLPFAVPGFGTHISLFTLIWVATTLWYTWYSMKQMDTNTMNSDQMKIMKYMQYAMPVVFMFFFNTFASGLTLYLCFSNILNIGQTVVTKQFFINHDKIKAQLEANRNKPKKTGGFRQRLEDAMKEQQRLQADKAKQPTKKK